MLRITSLRRRRLQSLLAAVREALPGCCEGYHAERYAAWSAAALSEGSPAAPDYAVAAALPWVQAWRARGDGHLLAWLQATAPDGVQAILVLANRMATDCSHDFRDCCRGELLEELLAVDRQSTRRQCGVYYTPPEIAAYLVRQVDQSLATHLHYALGLADTARDSAGLPAVRVLDPAAGAGIFLVATIAAIYRRFVHQRRSLGAGNEAARTAWNAYVPQHLLPRITGWEIMPPAVVAAHFALCEALHATGYGFESNAPLRLVLRDALTPPDLSQKEPPCTVIVGNPPYASLSTARHGWIESLIQSPERGYMRVDGEPLREKKHWLHDDYIKFLRLAQWHVEQAGAGVVGLLTNHGYLQNTSFRGLRWSLGQAFSHVDIVDLHGNAKSQECSPDGARDENPLGIAAGLSIGIFTRTPVPTCPAVVRHGELWGSRQQKLQALADGRPPLDLLTPRAPQYAFAPAVHVTPQEYLQAWPLHEAMPLNTTAPVTARDSFVVAYRREELIERMERFCDLSLSDDTLRAQYFGRTRSSKYAPGDSRGWKLAKARRALAADTCWRERIVRCQYRPLDERCLLWHAGMIDWPRPEVTQHLLAGPNVALIARRQSPLDQGATYFWATQWLPLDGIVRSDNRGSESIFPVWRYEGSTPRANFAPAFLAAMEQATGRRFVDRASRLDCETPSVGELMPLGIAAYIYGLFWSPSYRTRYQGAIAREFPRILLPANSQQFEHVAQRGRQLLQLHSQPLAGLPESTTPDCHLLPIAPGYPAWREGTVWLSATTPVCQVSESVWNLRIGTHQVARKWLKDRRGRSMMPEELASYREVVARLERTVAVCEQLAPL